MSVTEAKDQAADSDMNLGLLYQAENKEDKAQYQAKTGLGTNCCQEDKETEAKYQADGEAKEGKETEAKH